MRSCGPPELGLKIVLKVEDEIVRAVAVVETKLVMANGCQDLVGHLGCYRTGISFPEYPGLEFWLLILCKPVP